MDSAEITLAVRTRYFAAKYVADAGLVSKEATLVETTTAPLAGQETDPLESFISIE
jgi:hypothetical protein